MATNDNNCCKCTTPEYTITLNQQGVPGRQGIAGQNGFSPIIDVATNTPSSYTLTITTADGVITTPNLKSPLPSGGTEGQVLTNYGNNIYGWDTINAVTLDTNQTIAGVKTFSNSNTDTLIISDDEDEGHAYTFSPLNNTIYVCSASNGIPVASIGYVVQTDKLIAGNNISISTDNSGNVTISSTGGSTDNLVTLDTEQAITGAKIFNTTVTIADDIVTADNLQIANGAIEGVVALGDASGETHIYSNGDIKATINGTLETTVTTAADLQSVIDKVNSTTDVANDTAQAIGNFEYKAITSTEYSELTPDADTMYRLTDTNKVYLGTIDLTGGGTPTAIDGGNAQSDEVTFYASLLNNYDNATQTNLGGSTTVQATDTEV